MQYSDMVAKAEARVSECEGKVRYLAGMVSVSKHPEWEVMVERWRKEADNKQRQATNHSSERSSAEFLLAKGHLQGQADAFKALAVSSEKLDKALQVAEKELAKARAKLLDVMNI